MANTFKLNLNLENCTCNYSAGTYDSDTELNIILTPVNGYEFQNIPYWSCLDNRGRYRKGNFSRLEPNSNLYNYKLKVNEYSGISHVDVKAIATKQSAITDKYGLITVYKPTKEELIDIAKVRYISISANNNSPNIQYVDTADYLVSLMKLFVYLESDSRNKVYFGAYNMNVECDTIGTDIITLDCGNVNIVGKYKNSIDYENTDIKIYLPFIGFKELNTDDFMNKICNLTYQVNVINGESLAIVSADNNIIETYSCNVGFKIPYKLMNEMYISSKIEPNSNYLADMTPFLYVKNHIANIPVNMPYGNVNEYVQLSTLSGFTITKVIYFEVIHDTITMPEIEEIKALFLDGVIL